METKVDKVADVISNFELIRYLTSQSIDTRTLFGQAWSLHPFLDKELQRQLASHISTLRDSHIEFIEVAAPVLQGHSNNKFAQFLVTNIGLDVLHTVMILSTTRPDGQVQDDTGFKEVIIQLVNNIIKVIAEIVATFGTLKKMYEGLMQPVKADPQELAKLWNSNKNFSA